MIVKLKDIGGIKEAEFDLDKGLTVFIGPNNTGKTYASYCLYGLSKYFLTLSNETINSIITQNFDELFSSGVMNLNLEQIFTIDVVNKIYENSSLAFKEFLPQLFGITKENFFNSSIQLIISDPEELRSHLSSFNIKARISTSGVTIAIEKIDNETTIRLILQQSSPPEENNYQEIKANVISMIKRSIVQYCIRPYKTNSLSEFIPAERIGIAVFGKDLFSNRFTRTNEILNISVPNRSRIIEMMYQEFNTYSRIIQESLQDYDRLTRRKNERGNENEFYSLAIELEKKILKGNISVNSDGDIFYKVNDNLIKIQATGSIIKSLSTFVLYLKHLANKDQILFIDEPELSLHPDNQRLIARILAKLSNLGIKVIVSTHSDYFIRELNNLIMLNKEHAETNVLREKYGYEKIEILDYKKIGAYLFKENRHVKELEVTESGMEAATIDEEINNLNNTANDIYWTLFED